MAVTTYMALLGLAVGYATRSLAVHVPNDAPVAKYPALGSLTADERQLYDRMRAALSGDEATHFSDARHMVVWIRYFGNLLASPDAVMGQWESTLAWRAEMGMDETWRQGVAGWREKDPESAREIEQVLEIGCMDALSVGGGTIYVERYGCIDTPRFLEIAAERTDEYVRVVLEDYCRRTEDTEYLRPTNLIDMAGANLQQLRLLPRIHKWANEKQDNYPVTDGSKTFVLGSGPVVTAAWNAVRPWLNQTIQDNVNFLNPKKYPEILERVPACAVPAWALARSPELAKVVASELQAEEAAGGLAATAAAAAAAAAMTAEGRDGGGGGGVETLGSGGVGRDVGGAGSGSQRRVLTSKSPPRCYTGGCLSCGGQKLS